MLRVWSMVVLVAALRKPNMEDRLMKLQPVLEKLHGLDPKTFGMLNQMLDQAQVMSFVQENTSPMDMEDRLAKLGPILDKLKNIDPKTAAMLGKMTGMSFIQQPDTEEKMMKLEGVMEKLKGLDPKTFGMLNGMLEKAQVGQSFMQVAKPDMEDRLMKLSQCWRSSTGSIRRPSAC